MVDKDMLDYIHDYVSLDEPEFKELSNEFVDSQFQRLRQIAHLGLIAKTRKLARHDKLEHAYGTYWLCKKCGDSTEGIIRNKKAFALAGILHGIGHLPFSYDTECAVAKLYYIHLPTKDWLNRILDRCTSFLNRTRINQKASLLKESMDYTLLHRWFTVYKLAESERFDSDLGRQLAGVLLDNDLIEYHLLQTLDRIDSVLRDMHYLALGRIELNFAPLLKQFRKDSAGNLVLPYLVRIIDMAYDSLRKEVYFGSAEKCIASLLEKTLVKEVIDGHLDPSSLLEMSDTQLEDALASSETNAILLDAVVKKINQAKLVRVGFYPCDMMDKSPAYVEANLVATNMGGIHKYHLNKGIYVQCLPYTEFATEAEDLRWTISRGMVSISCDMDSARPKYVVGALLKAEKWFPEARPCAQLSCRLDAIQYLLGLQAQPNFDRYRADIYETLKSVIPSEDWKPELFDESWHLRDWAVFEASLSENPDWLLWHFVEFPEHWSSENIESVKDKIRSSRLRRRKNENSEEYSRRKQRTLEYFCYLEKVLELRANSLHGWVLPSVILLGNDGKQLAEVDVLVLYVPKPHCGPVHLDLFEVSYDNSEENRFKNRSKFITIGRLVKERFGGVVKVAGYFNAKRVYP